MEKCPFPNCMTMHEKLRPLFVGEWAGIPASSRHAEREAVLLCTNCSGVYSRTAGGGIVLWGWLKHNGWTTAPSDLTPVV